MPISAPPDWGTIDQAADRLHVTARTIRRMIAAGTIDARRFSPRVLRVDLNSLNATDRPRERVDTAEYVEQVLATAPPLTAEQVDRIAAILRGGIS